MNKITIGTCSNCGGPVSVPVIWHGVNPPVPECERCKAHPVRKHGPVIEMAPPPAETKFRTNTRVRCFEC